MENKGHSFRAELETLHHLLFDCVVATRIWVHLSTVNCTSEFGIRFESVARFWLTNTKHRLVNAFSSAVLWCLWELRNSMHFQDTRWKNIRYKSWMVRAQRSLWKHTVPDTKAGRVGKATWPVTALNTTLMLSGLKTQMVKGIQWVKVFEDKDLEDGMFEMQIKKYWEVLHTSFARCAARHNDAQGFSKIILPPMLYLPCKIDLTPTFYNLPNL